MREIHIMSGLPASGKTTEAQRMCEGRTDLVRISRDYVRQKLREVMRSSEYFPVSQEEEWKVWIGAINTEMVVNGKSVVIDQTTLGKNSLLKLCKDLIIPYNRKLILHVFETPLATCQWRNGFRDGFEYVPPAVIKSMHSSAFKDLKAEDVKEMLKEIDLAVEEIFVRTYV